MTRIHPNSSASNAKHKPISNDKREIATVLTVWKKSLLFNCKGYTVYDSKGDLHFRVDSYSSDGTSTEIILMDHIGKPLVSFRRKRLCLGQTWQIYNGEESKNPIFAVKKHLLGSNKILAHVSRYGRSEEDVKWEYVVEGSYEGRCCGVYDRNKTRVAEIQSKQSVGGVGFGNDVFRLIVNEAELDSTIAMSIVILLEQMYGS
ncbi:hypothetical protein ZOSMA_31G01070 [Zostera marina]|uniref:Uncharacterized protein n=1 Tax=Zostera marina TaxID=29655 RepID=A0A0K9P957_ZOSMR|nr:hypothetical protein ZOSMA_31G01070 [Zostera marina]